MKRTAATFLAFLFSLNALAGELEIPFERATRREAILVQAVVNGKPATLILDTGAHYSIFHPTLVGMTAAEFRTARFAADAPGLRGEAVWTTTSLRLGARRWNERRVVVMDLAEVSRVYGRQVDGILGQDVLIEFAQVTIDFRTRKIHLRD